MMRGSLLCLFLLLWIGAQAQTIIDVTRKGVRPDGKTLCTQRLNKLIKEAPDGAVICFPAGLYLTGTLHLRSHITLQIEEGACILGAERLEDYQSMEPAHDMSRYDTGAGTRNANLTGDRRWTRALILGQGLTDVTLRGRGTIDGRHLTDSLGEEGMRGPHTILLADCHNVHLEDLYIRRSANYAFLGYELQGAEFKNLRIEEGWDGIHIRGGESLHIDSCNIRTGDDCIAGGYWKDMLIEHCRLNSSCNGVRIMEPCEDVEIANSSVIGPGKFPHRTSGAEQRTGTIYGIVIEPGAWGYSPGDTRRIHIHNLLMDSMYGPMAYSMGQDNECYDIRIENIKATHCRLTIPFNNQGSARMWHSLYINDVSVEQ